MSYKDLDRTQLLPREKEEAPRGRRLDDTQELPPLPQGAVFSKAGTVRELSPLAPQEARQTDVLASTTNRQQKRTRWVLLFAACFALALFGGFVLSDALRSHEQTLADSRREAQQMEMRQQELAAREASLKKQRDSIAEQKRALEEKELELERKAQRAAGRTERIEQEKGKGSVVGDWMDKVTGKEKERREANEKNTAEIQQAKSDIASVQQSIKEAQSILDEVDKQLDNVNEMKEQADRLKAVAQETYAKNEGLISEIMQRMGEGADLLRRLLIRTP